MNEAQVEHPIVRAVTFESASAALTTIKPTATEEGPGDPGRLARWISAEEGGRRAGRARRKKGEGQSSQASCGD